MHDGVTLYRTADYNSTISYTHTYCCIGCWSSEESWCSGQHQLMDSLVSIWCSSTPERLSPLNIQHQECEGERRDGETWTFDMQCLECRVIKLYMAQHKWWSYMIGLGVHWNLTSFVSTCAHTLTHTKRHNCCCFSGKLALYLIVVDI